MFSLVMNIRLIQPLMFSQLLLHQDGKLNEKYKYLENYKFCFAITRGVFGGFLFAVFINGGHSPRSVEFIKYSDGKNYPSLVNTCNFCLIHSG